MKWENHQTLLTVLVTLIVAIFGFAQVHILSLSGRSTIESRDLTIESMNDLYR